MTRAEPMNLSRALLTLLLPVLLALGLGAGGLILALGANASADAAQARLQEALARHRQEPAILAEGLLVPGATQGLAASALQKQVLALVQDSEVQALEPRGAEAEGPLTRLRLTLRLQGEEAAILRDLIALEKAEPLILVDGLRITAAEEALADGAPGMVLGAELDLSAYAGQVAP